MRPLLGSLVALSILSSGLACSSSSDGDSNAQAGTSAGGNGAAGAGAGEAGSGAGEPGGVAGAAGAADAAGAAGAGEAPLCVEWSGDAQFGSAQDDAVLALAATRRGVVVGGYLAGTLGAENIEPAGNARGFVRGLSSSGGVVWETLHETAGSDTVEALAVTEAGTVRSVGRTNAAFPDFSNLGAHDAFVASYAANGQLLDLLQFGDERPQHPRRITVIGESGAVVGGYDDTFVPTNYVVDTENTFFATVQGLGSAAPEPAFFPDRSSSPDYAEGMAVDASSGDVFLSGVVTTGTQKGLFVRRQASDGALRWSKRLTTTGLEISGPLLADADGTLWLAAAWLRSTPTSDVVLLHFDAATGDIVDTFEFATEDAAEEVSSLVRDTHGDFWIAGTGVGPTFPGAIALGNEDAFVFHVAPDGSLIDAWQGGTPNTDMGRALAIDPCGHIILGGTTDGELVPGSAQGRTDAFVIRVPLAVRQ